MTNELGAIIPNDVFIGTSLILARGDQFLYGMRPVRLEGKEHILELTGIGGGMEEEDESISAGAIREAQEEIGCRVHPIACSTTLLVRGQNDIERVTLKGNERPAAVVFRYHRTPPHQPWHGDNQGKSCLIIFLAELFGSPYPTMELPHLIWLYPAQILQTAKNDVQLGSLLHSGAELICGNQNAPTNDFLLRLTDSQEALALALGDHTPSFYNLLFG